jgi:hypothetical protein
MKPLHDALTLSTKSKLLPSGKATNICVSQNDIAESFEISPSTLGDVFKKSSETIIT